VTRVRAGTVSSIPPPDFVFGAGAVVLGVGDAAGRTVAVGEDGVGPAALLVAE
jgi:hypothetical protein